MLLISVDSTNTTEDIANRSSAPKTAPTWRRRILRTVAIVSTASATVEHAAARVRAAVCTNARNDNHGSDSFANLLNEFVS